MWIVCAWHTPDYRPWAERLRASLERAGAPHDVIEVEKLSGGWEANTRRKAGILAEFMSKHPGKVIILVDADAEVSGDLSALASLPSDISLHGKPKYRQGNAWMQWLSGTMVVRPSPAARAFVGLWKDLSDNGFRGENDQSTLTKALLASHGLSIGMLDRRWIYGSDDCGPYIRHDSASQVMEKLHPIMRLAASLIASSRGEAKRAIAALSSRSWHA